MKSHSRRNQLTVAQKVYFYGHCTARHLVENGFGILSSLVCVFKSSIILAPSTEGKLVEAACVLHNWIQKHDE